MMSHPRKLDTCSAYSWGEAGRSGSRGWDSFVHKLSKIMYVRMLKYDETDLLL